ncbi:hypothetical protein ACLMJK_008334 [Lecanora helva]
MYPALNLFVSLFLYRYVRLIVNLFAFIRFRPTPLPDSPRLTSQDVTVVIPSIEGDGTSLVETVRSILATEPFEIILVTIHANVARAQSMVKEMGTSKIKIRSVTHPNKRRQVVRAIPEITTDVTVFADDDVLWPLKLLPWILAPLEDERYGGVGTNQRLRRAEAPKFQQRVYGYLNALYLERRNFDCASCMYMDGGLPCLSGRTVAYRSKIIKDEAFIHGFTNEEWLGRYQLNADDDNFMTRWLVSHDKKIGFQYHKEAEVLTTLEDNPKFVKQCLRWSRSNWRSNITIDFFLLPVSVLFGYLHGLVKAWAMVTLNVTAWGTRDGADDDDAYRMIRMRPNHEETGSLPPKERTFRPGEKIDF